jgi:hypothetical protein
MSGNTALRIYGRLKAVQMTVLLSLLGSTRCDYQRHIGRKPIECHKINADIGRKIKF